MALRDQLLEHLKNRPPSMFEEIMFRLNIRASDISGPRTTQTEVAMTLIQYLEQEELGLQRLQKLLNELDNFGGFLPEGAYLVGQKLREREEARESQAMEAAATRGEAPEDYRITPEKFYTFRPEAAWLGIFRDWDVQRSFHAELVRRVISASYGQKRCPAAAIMGLGGSGKSVALRRLGVDLSERGYKVWWAEEPERLLQFGMSQLVGAGGETCFLLIDDIQDLKNEHEYVNRLKREIQSKSSLVLIVACRELPNALRGRVKPGDGLIILDETADHTPILRRIGEIIPDWAEKAEQLAAETLQQARLIRLLLVLSRGEAAPADEQELETAFLEILADDIRRIRSVLPGLAEAVIDAAAICNVGRNISRETLVALADYHQQGASIPILLEEIDGNPRWQVLSSLLSHSPGYGAWKFHHDELAKGLLLAGQRGLLGDKLIGDDMWKKAVLDIVINRGSKFSKSYALSAFIRNLPGLIDRDCAVAYIHQLLTSANGHYAYLRLIVDEALALDEREILDLLLLAAGVSPFEKRLWISVSNWIKSYYPGMEQRAEVLEQLYRAGCRSSWILVPFLQYLSTAKANWLAKELLRDQNAPADVLCSCINLLGEEAKEDAKRLLEDENTTPEVLCSCINLLGEEAKTFAVEQIRSWNEIALELLSSCFRVAGGTPEGQKAAEEIFAVWDKGISNRLRVVALRASFDTPVRIQRAREILESWFRHYRPLVNAALAAFWNDPDAVTKYCKAILNRWHREIVYRRQHGLPEYDGHIIKALSNPRLRKEAHRAAMDMLSAEARSPGFLGAALLEWVENIAEGQWPLWSESDDEDEDNV